MEVKVFRLTQMDLEARKRTELEVQFGKSVACRW